MDISPVRRPSYYEEEEDESPRSTTARESNNENEMRFSIVPPRDDGIQGPRRQLTFPVSRAPERGRGERQHFTMRAVRGGLEDALVDLMGGRREPFVVIKLPGLTELESNQGIVAFRPFGQRRETELQFNVARSAAGQFRGYRGSLVRDSDAFTEGIDDSDQTLFPINLEKTGWPPEESVFSLVRVPGEGGYNVWTVSATDANKRMRLTLVLVAPKMAVRIFTFDGQPLD